MPYILRRSAVLSTEVVWICSKASCAIGVAVCLGQHIKGVDARSTRQAVIDLDNELVLGGPSGRFVLEDVTHVTQWTNAAAGNTGHEGSRQGSINGVPSQQVFSARVDITGGHLESAS